MRGARGRGWLGGGPGRGTRGRGRGCGSGGRAVALRPLSALARARRADLSAGRAASGASFVSSLESPAGRGSCWGSPGESRSPPPPGPIPVRSRPLRAQFSLLPPSPSPPCPNAVYPPPLLPVPFPSSSPSPPPRLPRPVSLSCWFPSSAPPSPLCGLSRYPSCPRLVRPRASPSSRTARAPSPLWGTFPLGPSETLSGALSPHPLGAESLLPGYPRLEGRAFPRTFPVPQRARQPWCGSASSGAAGCRRRTRSAFPPRRASRRGATLAATWRSSGYKVSRTWPLRGADTRADLASARNAPSPEADPEPRPQPRPSAPRVGRRPPGFRMRPSLEPPQICKGRHAF